MTERRVFIDTFMNKDDADYWIDSHLLEHKEHWFIVEADVTYVNGIWRAGCMFEKKQGELDFGSS